ncbi:hypothetical protein Ae201684P_011879 [Aphanomyces euteiches]|nr:hypothetical protein Ae201684P_011879 [Aphanomyces euteiches]
MVDGKQGQVDEATARRREYFREKQRSSRRQRRELIDPLRAQLTALQAQLDGYLQVGQGSHRRDRDEIALSWQSIAMHLNRENSSVIAERNVLAQKVEAYRVLVAAMAKWVTSTECISPKALVRWRDVSLPSHVDARKQAKEWATQQMYFNTDAVYHLFPHVAADEDVFIFDMDVSGASITCKDYSQCIWPAPLEVSRYMLRHYLSEVLDGAGTIEDVGGSKRVQPIEWTENTVLYYHKRKPMHDDETGVCSLQAQFYQADGAFLSCGKSKATTFATLHCIRRKVSTGKESSGDVALRVWPCRIDLRRLDRERTLARMVNIGSIELIQSGFGSFDSVAEKVGADTTHLKDDASKIQVLRGFLSEQAIATEKQLRRRVNLLLPRLWKELSHRHCYTI